MTTAKRITVDNKQTLPAGLIFRIEYADHEYNVNKNQVDGKTEEELNIALTTWLDFNHPEDSGKVGVHINRDGTYVIWTGLPPTVWPEDEVIE